MTEATQNLIDEANATAYILSIMAESAENLSTDAGMAEALNGMMLRLFEAARDCEQAERDAETSTDASTERIVLTMQQGFKLSKALGVTADQLADAIATVNGV